MKSKRLQKLEKELELDPGKCEGCGKNKKKLCFDGWCEDCHITIEWEDCLLITKNKVKKTMGSGDWC